MCPSTLRALVPLPCIFLVYTPVASIFTYSSSIARLLKVLIPVGPAILTTPWSLWTNTLAGLAHRRWAIDSIVLFILKNSSHFVNIPNYCFIAQKYGLPLFSPLFSHQACYIDLGMRIECGCVSKYRAFLNINPRIWGYVSKIGYEYRSTS